MLIRGAYGAKGSERKVGFEPKVLDAAKWGEVRFGFPIDLIQSLFSCGSKNLREVRLAKWSAPQKPENCRSRRFSISGVRADSKVEDWPVPQIGTL